MILRALLLVALLAVAAYGVWEVRRWQTPAGREFVSPRQRRIRGTGLFFLLLSLILWLGGTYVAAPARHPRTRAQREAVLRAYGYWIVTMISAIPLIPLALLDSRENLRRLSDERRRLLQETLSASSGQPPNSTHIP